jgi:hypothetical protein
MPILSQMMSKRDLAELRRIERRVLAGVRRRRRLAQLRCFWSKPLGHVRNDRHVCVYCGHDAGYGQPVLVRARAPRD